jgi:hypothetical protein
MEIPMPGEQVAAAPSQVGLHADDDFLQRSLAARPSRDFAWQDFLDAVAKQRTMGPT